MNTKIELLTEAMLEIRRLRRENEILGAKVSVMELFACVLHTKPASFEMGQTVDIVWMLEKEVDRIKSETPNVAKTP